MQSSLKIAALRADKANGEIERLLEASRGKSEALMVSLFTELNLPFESGQTPGELLRSLVSTNEATVKELQDDLEKKNKLVDKMRQDAADGNHEIIEERDKLLVERDELAEGIKVAKEAREASDAKAAELVKENKGVHVAAKAAARGEVEQLQSEIAKMQDTEAALEAAYEQLERMLESVQAELVACSKELRLAQAAGKNGGYYFSAALVPKTSRPSPHSPGVGFTRERIKKDAKGSTSSRRTPSARGATGRRRGGILPTVEEASTSQQKNGEGSTDALPASSTAAEPAHAYASPSTYASEMAAGAAFRSQAMLNASFSVKAKEQGLTLAQAGAAAAAAVKMKKEKALGDHSDASPVASGTPSPSKQVKSSKPKTKRSPPARAEQHHTDRTLIA